MPVLPVPVPSPHAFFAPPLPALRAEEEEAPTTPKPPIVIAQPVVHIPDYSKWLYPVRLSASTAAKPEMKFPLAEAKTPHVLSARPLLRWCEADVLASLPATLPPEYVIFGGARYSGAPLDLLRPPPHPPRVPAKKTSAFYASAEAQRLQFLQDQLDVAKNFLKIEARRLNKTLSPAAADPPAPPPLLSCSERDDVLTKPGEEEDVSKATIWTTAYFGTPQQLHRALTSKRFDGMLSCAGQVQYRRRQWGLKRAGETFVLGLGMKATALQFAAAAGKLDSVVLLLTSGAKDTGTPRLQQILSPEAMAMVNSICAPRVRPARVPRAPPAEEAVVDATQLGTGSSFENEQVTGIDDSAYSQLGSVPFFSSPAFT